MSRRALWPPPLPHMSEIGIMWQIGILTGNTFLLKNGSFSALSDYEFINRERVSRPFDVELHIPLLALTPPKSLFVVEFMA